VTATVEHYARPIELPALGPAGAHPRLFFGPEDVPELRERSTTTHSHIWRRMKLQLDGALELGPRDLVYPGETADGDECLWIRDVSRFAAAYAFGHLISGDERYFEQAKQCVMWLLYDPFTGEWGEVPKRSNKELASAEAYLSIAMVWDWCHDAFTADERERVRLGVLRRADEMYRAVASNGYAEPGWFRNIYRGWMNGHSTANRCGIGLLALAMRGESFEGVERRSDSSFEDWIAEAAWGHTQNLLRWPADGSWAEGIGYGCHPVWYLLVFAHAYERATGVDLTETNRDFLANFMYYRLYHGLDPDGARAEGGGGGGGAQGSIFSYGDSPNHDWHDPDALIWRMASKTRDGVLQAYADSLFGHETGRNWHFFHGPLAGWFHYLWYDATLEPDGSGLAELPQERAWRNAGVVVARDGWEPECTALHFKCGPPSGWVVFENEEKGLGRFGVGHAHGDQGTLNLYALGEFMLVDSGGYYVGETKHHNTILVDGAGQVADERGIHWKNFDFYRDLDVKPQLEMFDNCGSVARWAATFGTAYPHELGVTRIRREVVYLRAAPGGGDSLVAVYDICEAESPRRFEALWHVSGDATVAEARIDTTGAKGGAALTIEAFSHQPDVAVSAAVRRTTADAKAEWLCPVKPVTEVGVAASGPLSRLAVVTLIHVRPAGEAGGAGRPAAKMSALHGDGVVGAVAEGGGGGGGGGGDDAAAVFVFPAEPGTPIESVSYAAPDRDAVHVISGVNAGAGYLVEVTGGEVSVSASSDGELRSSAQGTLVWSVEGGNVRADAR